MTRRLKLLLALAPIVCGMAVAWIVGGCGCPHSVHAPLSAYNLEASLPLATVTPLGIRVVTNGQDVDLAKVDADFTAVSACMKDWFKKTPWISFDAKCVSVYIVTDWRFACEDPKMQIFGEAPFGACADKGFVPREGCVCGWRTAVQGDTVIVPPSLYMLKAGLVQYFSGYSAYDVWNTLDLAKCANP